MANIQFHTRSVKDLQQFLKERGVIFSDQKKVDLVELCEKSSAAKIAYTIDLCMYRDIQSGPISVLVMQSRLLH